jgi:hypothetical protein
MHQFNVILNGLTEYRRQRCASADLAKKHIEEGRGIRRSVFVRAGYALILELRSIFRPEVIRFSTHGYLR